MTKNSSNNKNLNKQLSDRKESEFKEGFDQSNKEKEQNELDKLTQNKSQDDKLGSINNNLFRGSLLGSDNVKESIFKEENDPKNDNNPTNTPLFNLKSENSNNQDLLNNDDFTSVRNNNSEPMFSKANLDNNKNYVKSGNNKNEDQTNNSASIKPPSLPLNFNFAESMATNPEGMKKFVEQFVHHLQTAPNSENILAGTFNSNNNLGGTTNTLRMKTEEIDKVKKIEELKEKVESLEKEKIIMIKRFYEKEKVYIDRITKLENILHASDKWDLFSLEKQNKEYEIKVHNLSKQVLYLQEEINKEKYKNNSFIGELMILKQQLVDEISEIKNFKLNTFKKNFGEKFLGGLLLEEKNRTYAVDENILNAKNNFINTNNNNNKGLTPEPNSNKDLIAESEKHGTIIKPKEALTHNFHSAAILSQGNSKKIFKGKVTKSVGK